jgi:hypothetical protein
MIEERRIKTGHALVALALVVVGVVIGWATDGGGSQGVGGGDVSAGAGPTRTVDGIPVGYKRSREGAVAAALNYGRVLARPEFVTDPARRRSILEAVATPGLVRQYEGADRTASLASLAQTPVYRATREGRPAVWQTVPLGYRVDQYSGDEAEISAWSMAIVGAGDAAPRASFVVGASRLRWDGGDWKFSGDSGRTVDGPTPALLEDAEPSSSAQFRARLRGLGGVRYVP